jgi:hypothetical protein
MRSIKPLLRLCALASGLVLAGCATSIGPSVGVSIAPGARLGLSVSPCSPLGIHPSRAGLHVSPSVQGMERLSRAAAIQAKHSLASSDVRVKREGWKRLAAGGC